MRTILASAAVAALISPTLRATAAELKPLVVIGIPHDSVAIKYPVPAYPRNAHVLRIDGIVRLLVQVERGEIMNITAQSGPPALVICPLNNISYKLVAASQALFILRNTSVPLARHW